MKLINKDEFIANEIKFYLIKYNVKKSDKLPSERDLSEYFGVQRATIRAAYKILEEEGIVDIKERSGRYLGHAKVKSNLQQIKSFSDKLSDMGSYVENELLFLGLIEVDKSLYRNVKLPIGTAIYKITRVRKIVCDEGVIPIAIEHAYIPEHVAPCLNKFNMEECSLFDVLKNEYKCIPKREEQLIGVVYANEFEAKVLKINQNTALVKKEGITYDVEENILQYLYAVFNKEWVEFYQSNPIIEEKIQEVMNGL